MMVAAFLAALLLQDDPASLIEKLRSDDVEVREAASKQLKELGAAAKPVLEKAAKDPDGEVASRAAYLLRILQLKAELTSNLQKAMPDAAERLAKSDLHNWTRVFIEATEADPSGRRKLPAIGREDLIPLAVNAVRGAGTAEEKILTCWIASNWRLKAALPEMLKLPSDEDAHVRRMTLVWCVVLGGRDAAATASERLKDDDVEIRRHGANHLAFMGTKAQIPALQAALKDPDPTVQLNAARALGKLGDRSAVATLLPMLDTGLRANAAVALGELGCKEHAMKIASLLQEDGARWYALTALELLDARDQAETIARYLEVGGPGTPGHAALILANLQANAYSDRIAAMVKNKIPGDYGLAILALGRMGDPRHAGAILPMLKDGSNYVRADAAEALTLLDARDAAGDIAALLKDPDVLVRRTSAMCLGKLASRMTEADSKRWRDALVVAEKDDAESVRLAASISLIRMKARDAADAAAIVRSLDSTWFESWKSLVKECSLMLLQLHEGAAFEKLTRAEELKRDMDSVESLAERLQESGLKLLGPEEVLWTGRLGKGRKTSLLEAFSTRLTELREPIVEKDTIRLVRPEAALEYWMKRLSK